MDEKYQQLMQSYNVPPSSPNLARRIINAAAKIEQKKTIWQWLEHVCRECNLPAPAYGFTSILLVGFLAGFVAYSSPEEEPQETVLAQWFNQSEEWL